MRKLIYVPIVHTTVDLGPLLPAAKAEFLKRYGPKEWQEHTDSVRSFWEGLRERISGLELDYVNTYLYQDGLPVCGRELAIVTDLAGQGSLNHQLLVWLVEQGATLTGTESPEILVQEYELARAALAAPEGQQRQEAMEEYRRKGHELLARRDDYIRQRIAATLPEGRTGLLLIGLMHRVDEGLPKDISVSYLIHRLPFRRAADIGRIAGPGMTLC